MAMLKNFEHTVKEKVQKKTVENLTVLKESDRDTIYNLIFKEKKEEKDVPHM